MANDRGNRVTTRVDYVERRDDVLTTESHEANYTTDFTTLTRTVRHYDCTVLSPYASRK